MTPPKPRDVVEDIIGRELPTYDSVLRERDHWKWEYENLCKFTTDYENQRDALKQANEKLREGLETLVVNVQSYDSWARPCYALDKAKEALAEADELEGK